MPRFPLTDCISIKDFRKQEIQHVLTRADQIQRLTPEKRGKLLQGKTVATLFFEPSTRTRLSFETAAGNLGARVISMADSATSSTAKGESLSDTVRTIQGYADAIVMRHPKDGAARLAADAVDIPVINAGDGINQHPTQTLLDLYTIQKACGKIDGLTIGFSGDLKHGRTVHSLTQALQHFNVKTAFISPQELQLPAHYARLHPHAQTYNNLPDALPHLDVLYCTRIQKERFADQLEYERLRNVFELDKSMLERHAQPGLKLLHPLPRVTEIHPDVDDTPHAHYFQQAHNGIPVRQAILDLLLNPVKR